MSDLKKVKKRERGAVLVFTVFVMVVLIGMAALAIDIGQMYVAKQRAQNVCDAAAQAGVRELATEARTRSMTPSYAVDTTRAETAAELDTTTNNNLVPTWLVLDPDDDLAGVKITFPPPGTILTADSGKDITVKYDGQAIRADGYVNVDCAFAGIFGMNTKDIHAQATAIVTGGCVQAIPLTGSKFTITGDPGEMPDITSYTLYTLHASSHVDGELGPGNYLSLRFGDDPGMSKYREYLANSTEVCAGVSATVESSSQPGYAPMQTFKGLEDRLLSETDSRFSYDKNNPIGSGETAWQNFLDLLHSGQYPDPDPKRLVIIPLLEETDINGSKPVTIAGFAGFFIRNVYAKDTTDPDGTIRYAGDVCGWFVWGTVVGSGDVHWYVPAPSSTPPTIPDQMIVTTRLIS